jgi:hypothetical protein
VVPRSIPMIVLILFSFNKQASARPEAPYTIIYT